MLIAMPGKLDHVEYASQRQPRAHQCTSMHRPKPPTTASSGHVAASSTPPPIVRTDRHQAPCRLPPIKVQYVVAWLKGDYSQTIIARDARDYAWIMARTPTIPATDYDALVARVVDMGYMAKNIRKVPQRWPDGAGERREGSE